MRNLLTYAQSLVYTLVSLMPSRYQQNSLQTLLELFLQASGRLPTAELRLTLPEHSQTLSASALSRFLNKYQWSCRAVIRAVRKSALQQILAAESVVGRRPTLQVILDLTTLEKTGKFKGLGSLIRVYNGKRGLHLVVLYIALGRWRLPWSFRVYRGKGHPGCVQLGLRLLSTLPKSLTKRYQVLVLVDTAFGSIDFFKQVRQMKFHAVAGVRTDRRLAVGGTVSQVKSRGQQVYLEGLGFPVTLSWYWLERDDGTREQRFVVSTKPFSWAYISRLGKRRWLIEGFFKTAKHRFGLHRFGESALQEGFPTEATALAQRNRRFSPKGQSTLLGVYRFLVLSIVAYLLSHWAHLCSGRLSLPDWGEMAMIAAEALFPQLVLLKVLLQMKRLRQLARKNGLDLAVKGWQYG